jgi:hypothetical protein
MSITVLLLVRQAWVSVAKEETNSELLILRMRHRAELTRQLDDGACNRV